MKSIATGISEWRAHLKAPDRPLDPELLAKARKGKPRAVAALVRRFEHRIARIIEARLAGARIKDKEDIFQDALATVYTKLESEGFHWESEAAFFRWLVLIVTNAIASQLAVPALEEQTIIPSEECPVEALDDVPLPAEQMIDVEVISMLAKALEALDPQDREIVQSIADGASLSAVARACGISYSGLKRRYGLALKELRKTIVRLDSLDMI